MEVITIINGSEFRLATNLRVAYELQGCHNHKPYLEIFQSVSAMPLERQIEMLFVAFKIANPEVSMTFNQNAFLNYYLDHFNLKQIMEQLQAVIKGITGDTEDDNTPEQAQGN